MQHHHHRCQKTKIAPSLPKQPPPVVSSTLVRVLVPVLVLVLLVLVQVLLVLVSVLALVLVLLLLLVVVVLVLLQQLQVDRRPSLCRFAWQEFAVVR